MTVNLELGTKTEIMAIGFEPQIDEIQGFEQISSEEFEFYKNDGLFLHILALETKFGTYYYVEKGLTGGHCESG